MKSTVAILTRWRREDPDRLLACALRQARELAEVVPELDGLRSQNAALAQQLEIQTKRIAQLEEALQAAERAAHRQAAPFRIEEKKRVLAPKPPGRKHGHPGAFRHRPDHIDEYIEVELCACPHCGARDFIDQSQIEQFIEDTPPVRPHVTRLTTYEATCVRCGQHVRSSHPLQMSLATGAASVQLGPRALALAADLNKAKGLSMRKTCVILRDCFSLQLSAGGLSQALDRLATKVHANTRPLLKNCATHRWFTAMRPAGGSADQAGGCGFSLMHTTPFIWLIRAGDVASLANCSVPTLAVCWSATVWLLTTM
jgi:transposase